MSRYRVLVVEDNRIEALDLIKIIQAHGYDLAGVAKSGEEAVKIAKEKNPDVILMDIKLSGEIDGITAAQAISKIDHIPIIYLTAYSDLKTIRRATATRLSGFIPKPFSEQDIAQALEVAIYKHESERLVDENRQWLKTVLESVGEGIIAANADGVIQLINPAACTILGVTTDVIDRPLHTILTIYRSSDDRSVSLPYQVKEKTPLSEIDYPLYIIHPDGSKIYIDGMISPLEESNHGCSGFVLNIRDISETIVMKRVVHDAYKQIEENIEKFALLNDQIRNPLSIIVAILDINECEHLKEIMPFIHEIDRIIDQLDKGYIASSKIRGFLKRYHEID